MLLHDYSTLGDRTGRQIPEIGPDIGAYLMRGQCCGKRRETTHTVSQEPGRVDRKESSNDTPTKSPCSTAFHRYMWFSSALRDVKDQLYSTRVSFRVDIKHHTQWHDGLWIVWLVNTAPSTRSLHHAHNQWNTGHTVAQGDTIAFLKHILKWINNSCSILSSAEPTVH